MPPIMVALTAAYLTPYNRREAFACATRRAGLTPHSRGTASGGRRAAAAGRGEQVGAERAAAR